MVKKLALGALTTLVASFAVMSFRAARMPSLQPPAEAGVADTDTSAFLALHAFLAESYPLVHAALLRETVLDRVRRVVADERVQVRIAGEEPVDPSPVSDTEGPAWRMLSRTIRQVLAGRDVIVAPYLVMGGTDAKWYSGRSHAIFRFPPTEYGPS